MFIGMVKAKVQGKNWPEICTKLKCLINNDILEIKEYLSIWMGHMSWLFSHVDLLGHAGHVIYQTYAFYTNSVNKANLADMGCFVFLLCFMFSNALSLNINY